MTIDYYDRDGKPMEFLAWAKKFEETKNRLVKQETVGDYFISTVWLGLDHNFSMGGPPLIFETMVFKKFPNGSEDEEEMERYSTEEEALAGHERMVKKWNKK